MTQPSENVIATFYQSFQRHDAAGMSACYHPDVTFHDPVFQTLHGQEAGGMWQMLLAGSPTLEVTFHDITITGDQGTARWEAKYVFSSTGRPVHNRIVANMRLQDGKIISHVDSFSLWRWAGMALGLQGTLLGWTPFVRASIRQKARERLQRYMARART
jgi:ketosteroid isomerase-like protein